MARRENRVFTRLDDDELKKFLELFEQSRVKSPSEFIRQAVLTAQVKAPPSAELVALLREVRAQGNNLNQISKIANASGILQPEVLDEVRQQQKHTLTLLKGLL